MQSTVADLTSAWGSQFDFVFGSAPYNEDATGAVWMRDAPGGKGAGTTDPDWALDSVNYLNDLVASQGPFFGILGYSQGSAFIPVYLAQKAASVSFEVALMFNGYIPTTHSGLVSAIDQASPFGGIRSLVFMGANDGIITNDMTQEQASKFTSPTVITDQVAGHHPPTTSHSTFNEVVSWLEGGGGGGGGGPAPSPSPAPTPTPTPTPTPMPTPPTTTITTTTTTKM